MPTYTVGNQTFEVNNAGTIVGGNNNGYGYQYTNSSAPATPAASSSGSLTPSVSSGSSGGSLIPSANSGGGSLIPSTGVSAGTSGNSANVLASYATNTAARDAEIARAQAVYAAQAALGNWDVANLAHDWANQVRDAGGLAGTYNTSNGSPLSPTPSPPTPTVPEKPISLIPPVPKVEIPQYVAYQPKEFQYTPPNYSISADPSKTSFIPTTRARDRWATQEATNAENAYKQYTSQFGAYAQNYKQQQDAITNALAQKELETRTVKEQADAAMKAAGVKSEAEKVALTAAQNRWQTLGYVANEADAALLGVPVGTKTNDASYRDASLAKGSGGSGGGLTGYQQYEIGRNTVNDAAKTQQDLNARIDAAAKADPRLENPSLMKYANNTTIFSLDALQQAYKKKFEDEAAAAKAAQGY